MESLQLSQVLADLSNLGAAVYCPHRNPQATLVFVCSPYLPAVFSRIQEPEAAAAIVSANIPVVQITRPRLDDPTNSASASASASPSHQLRPSGLQRAWSSDTKFDKFGRRILINSPSRSGSAANSIPGTPRRGDSDFEDEADRASTLIALYDIRSKLKQQDNSSLVKAREKINAIAAKQQAQQAAERNSKAADQLRRNRYSFPKPGL